MLRNGVLFVMHQKHGRNALQLFMLNGIVLLTHRRA